MPGELLDPSDLYLSSLNDEDDGNAQCCWSTDPAMGAESELDTVLS